MKRILNLLMTLLLLSSMAFSVDRQTTTTVTDPAGNVSSTVYFGAYPFSISQFKGSGTLLSLSEFCYNGASHPCAPGLVSRPVTQKDAFVTVSGVNPSQVSTTYNIYGLSTDLKMYDFGPSLVSEQVLTYATVANPNIVALPSDINTKNGSGTTVARVQATFDGTGNLLTKKTLVGGSTFLTETFTYTAKGVLATSTGVNGAQTTYTNAACSGTKPTVLAIPIIGNESLAWDCNGGVSTSITDVNGSTYVTAHSDPFFRVTSGTDAAGVTTTYKYTPLTYEINTSYPDSTSKKLLTFNNAGRPIVSQVANGGSYDTVSVGYDTLGRKTGASLPCSAGPGGACPTNTQASYDGGAVPTTVLTDTLGSTTTTTYTKGDKTVLITPAPAGESVKGKQYEYDGLGRLTSVCELSTGVGSGACGQRVPQNGFLTTYAYDSLGNMLSVIQGSQSRVRTYDNLGRVLTSTQPETGLTTYTYDTTGDCGGTTSNGDLVERVDANGNTTCYHYDAASRLTSVTYSGTNPTDSVFYVYDTATVNSVAMQNGKGRLVEAYTCTSCPGTKKTDVGLSYNSVGQVTDMYQSTTNSGGYYHVALTLHGNQTIKSLTLTPAVIPVITYGVDVQGRTSSVSASGSSLVVTTSRGPANQVNSITYGSFDTDVFGYDTNLKTSSYSFSAGGNSITGTFGYNANGTLATKAVHDPFSASNTENCVYRYDAVVRLSSANCGTVNQAFDYDRYGNQTKTGTFPFAPTYSATTNRMTAIGAVTPTYDANGNLLTDGTNTYTWDAEGHMLSVTGVTSITYNAFGMQAEQTRGSAHQQFVYFPSGDKLAIMNGQSLVLARVPLTGGAQAVYTSSGLAYYAHADNMGSVRLTTTPNGAVQSDLAYAPFGEPYNNGGIAQTVLNFTGHNQDTISGLYDAPQREYNPAFSRWVSSDKINQPMAGDPQTFNQYAYATNRPLGLIDPTGAEAEDSDAPVYAEGVDPANGETPNQGDNVDGYLAYSGSVYGAGNGEWSGGIIDTASETLGNVHGLISGVIAADPMGLVAGEIILPTTTAGNAFEYGPYEGADNIIMRIWRTAQTGTGNGIHSLTDVVDMTNRVLDRYGSLFSPGTNTAVGPKLALGLTNPNMTRAEVDAAYAVPGFRSGLQRWADSIGAKTWMGFPINNSVGWKRGLFDCFEQVRADGGTIHFNLDGLEDIPGTVRGDSTAGFWVNSYNPGEKIKVLYKNQVTVSEMRYLKQNWENFNPIVYFYRDGKLIINTTPGAGPYVPW